MKLLLLLSAMLSALTSVVGAHAPRPLAVAEVSAGVAHGGAAAARRAVRVLPRAAAPRAPVAEAALTPVVFALKALAPLYGDRRRE